MKNIKLDEKQKEIKARLDSLSKQIVQEKKTIWPFFKKELPAAKSLYIFGDVGRGKSMLMKGFYNSISVSKSYFHFNEFMENIHLNLKEIRDEQTYYPDELIEATKRLISQYKVICFDEFQVNDIADAMLLSRIFNYIFSQNIIVIFTSNFAPHNLYPDGLQRQKFLEFVDLVLLKNSHILNLDSEVDYRKKYSWANETRFFLSAEKDAFFSIIDALKEEQSFKTKTIKVWGRKILIKKTLDIAFDNIKKTFLPTLNSQDTEKCKKKIKIAIFDCSEIINSNLAASDFRAIANEFDLIFLINLSKFSADDINEARRFVLFIDEIYEKKLALLTLSTVNIADIFDKYYLQKANSRIFLRSRSRISEIKSDSYFLASKIFN